MRVTRRYRSSARGAPVSPLNSAMRALAVSLVALAVMVARTRPHEVRAGRRVRRRAAEGQQANAHQQEHQAAALLNKLMRQATATIADGVDENGVQGALGENRGAPPRSSVVKAWDREGVRAAATGSAGVFDGHQMATGSAATGMVTGMAGGVQLVTPLFGNRDGAAARGGTSQDLVGDEVKRLKQGIAEDLERMGRDPAVVSPEMTSAQQPSQVVVLAHSPQAVPPPVPIEEAITSLSPQPLLDPAQSQATARSTTDNAPAQINANPTKQGQLVSGVAVVDYPAKSPVNPNVVVGPVVRPTDVRESVGATEMKTAAPIEPIPAADDGGAATAVLSGQVPEENNEVLADTSEPSDNTPIVQSIVANLRSTQKQLAVANEAQKLLTARTKALEMKLGEAREAVEEQERVEAKAKADAAVGLDVKVKPMISTDWKPWQRNE